MPYLIDLGVKCTKFFLVKCIGQRNLSSSLTAKWFHVWGDFVSRDKPPGIKRLRNTWGPTIRSGRITPQNKGVNRRKPLKDAYMKLWGSSRERSQCLRVWGSGHVSVDQLAHSVGELVLGSRDWCGALYVVRWSTIFWPRRWGFIAFIWCELTPVQNVEKLTHWCTA